MRYEAKMKRISTKLPPIRKEFIATWFNEIFSTNGWSVHLDKNGVLTKTGDVPAKYTPEYTKAFLRSRYPKYYDQEEIA